MGRPKDDSAQERKKIPNQVKDKLKSIVQKLLTKCSHVNSLTRSAKWEEMEQIFEMIDTIQLIEKDYLLAFPVRKHKWEEFYKWCSENGAEFSAVEVKEIKDENYGVFSKRNLKEGEAFLSIPKKIMMNETSANNSKLGPLISKDQILQLMPNVQIAMHLVTEFLEPKSFWKPYISILPSSYSTVLYYTLEEVRDLQRSPVLDEVFKLIRSVIRQYCYFFQLFQSDAYAKSLNIGPYFTYDLYRWAVSTVMTRQNTIPSPNEQRITSLVPFFDMCNHSNGKLSTDFSLEKDELISYTFKPFSNGEEVCIFYGSRTNAEFFVHNGFVYPENENDSFEIKLGISKSDSLFSLKTDLCSRLNIPVNGPFYLNENYLHPHLLHFLEIIVMRKDELDIALNSEDYSLSQLELNADIKEKAINYIKDRIMLLLKSYQTIDENILESVHESIHQCNNLQLLICEKKILESLMNFVSSRD